MIKKFTFLYFTYIILLIFTTGCAEKVQAPAAMSVVPTEQQLDWFNMEYYGFIHFGPNTFTGDEWGSGEEDPKIFNPTALDTDQWAKVCSEAGMKGIVLTVKHLDGFCLYPSAHSTHTIRESGWMDGKGDILKMLSESCRKYGLKLGIYLSPWDMNHPDFATDRYNDTYISTIEEVLTNYGEIFEFWYDGGDTGKDGKKQIYDWDRFDAKIRQLQPNAMINRCRDLRWVGNEQGYAPQTCWATITRDSVTAAEKRGDGSVFQLYGTGDENGTTWSPAECDVSIRPGWFHRSSEDARVKTVAQLFDIYMGSVGRNSTLILNLAPDQRGLIPETEVNRLIQLRKYLDQCFSDNLALGTKITASDSRSSDFSAAKVINNNNGSYWATSDNVTSASLTFEWNSATTMNAVVMQEYIKLGQRVRKFDIEILDQDGQWRTVTQGTTVGRKRIVTFDDVTTTKLRINITDARAAITLCNVEIFKFPTLLTTPTITRDSLGNITIKSQIPNQTIVYTIDGTKPNLQSTIYNDTFICTDAADIKACTIDSVSGQTSAIAEQHYDIIKTKWQIVDCSGDKTLAKTAIDDNINTFWSVKTSAATHPYHVVIDMGKVIEIKGFSYTPRQDGNKIGNISEYSLYLSPDNVEWECVKQNQRFDNIANNPVEQRILFDKIHQARYLKLITHNDTQSLENNQATATATIAEIGVITK